jgi:CrcB protein
MMRQAFWIGLGGFLGANARALVGSLVTQRLGMLLPYGTLVVNVTGCLLIGLLVGVLERRDVHPGIRPALGLGFLGAYTTFSAFGFETVHLVREGSLLLAVVYVTVSIALGLTAVWIGLAAGRVIA